MPLLSRKKDHDTVVVEGGVAAEEHPNAAHSMTEDYASAGAHAVVSQIFRELTDRRNMQALTGLILEQAGNVARQATTEEGRKGSRISAQEAVVGSYDAVERKWKEWWEHLPRSVVPMMLGAGIFVGMLLMGLLLALWRFALFGLH
ncbi:hypothetical protein ABBQ38_009538 [Trebouxia sp. C0009 RCD-2024]